MHRFRCGGCSSIGFSKLLAVVVIVSSTRTFDHTNTVVVVGMFRWSVGVGML